VLLFPPVEKVKIRSFKLSEDLHVARVIYLHQPRRIPVWQRTDQSRVNESKDRDISSNAQNQRVSAMEVNRGDLSNARNS